MDKYENLGLVGEGSYGMVLKCKHKETHQTVAIKKFLESEDDRMVKKIAMREIRMLKQLRHENLVNLIEVFRRKKRLYLVFEFVDHTVLDDLERCPNGLDEAVVRKVLWQVLRGIEFCHLHNIIHRDIKPENILVSKTGIIKLCDFGFARAMAQPGEVYTDYVATRWYRSPELLVGDTKYGRAVDIWAVGCLVAEMLTGEPLFPGDSDIDQLYHIVKCFGNLTQRHREIFYKNPLFVGMKLPEVRETQPLEKKFPRLSHNVVDIMKQALKLEANDRPTCSQMLRHDFFHKDGFAQKFAAELKARIEKEKQENPLFNGKRTSSSGDNGLTTVRAASDSTTITTVADDGGGGPNKDTKKKKKHQDYKKENKSSPSEKPKRKLPDPERFMKKPSMPLSMANSSVVSTFPNSTSNVADSNTQERNTPNVEMPPIQSQTSQGSLPRPNEKVKKQPANFGPTKKSMMVTNQHANISPQQNQGGLQNEKTVLHDKAQSHKVHAGDENSYKLPELKGAEANPNKSKSKKGYLATVPHITNIDPFHENQYNTNEYLPDV